MNENINKKSNYVQKEKSKPQEKTIIKSIFMLLLVTIVVLSTTACRSMKDIENSSHNSHSSYSSDDADSESGEDYSFLDGVDFGYDAYIAAMNQLADHYLYINHIDYANHTYTVDDYKNMKYLSENDLIGYYNVLGEEESEKVVQALGYDGWDDYLTKNNYLRDGKPSFIEWERQLHIAYHKLMSEQNK